MENQLAGENVKGTPETGKTLKKEIRRASDINAVILFLFSFITIILTWGMYFVVYYVAEEETGEYETILSIAGSLIQYLVTVPILLLAFRKKLTTSVGSLFRKPKMPTGWVIKWIVISLFLIYAMGYVSTFLFALIEKLTGTELQAVDFSLDGAAAQNWIYFISLAILAPLFEEILFRGMIYANMKNYGRWSMVIIAGLMFGFYHMNYEQVLYAGVMGILACFLVAKTGSIIPSLAVHLIMNTIAGLQLVVTDDLDLDRVASGDMAYYTQNLGKVMVLSIVGYVIMGIMIGGLVLLIIELVKHRGSFSLKYQLPEPHKGNAVTYIFAPLTVILFVAMLALTVINAIGIG